MKELVLTTFDWVPEQPRGQVRDLRIRWLLEEIGRPYRVETVPSDPDLRAHQARQPFLQVPMIRDGALSLFESGAIALYLSRDTALMPGGGDEWPTTQWVFAALNSVETMSLAWQLARFFDGDMALAARHEARLRTRLAQLQEALAERPFLVAGQFTVADLLMADILRIPAQSGLLDDLHGLARYTEDAVARPAFERAMTDHMAHWIAADARRTAPE